MYFEGLVRQEMQGASSTFNFQNGRLFFACLIGHGFRLPDIVEVYTHDQNAFKMFQD